MEKETVPSVNFHHRTLMPKNTVPFQYSEKQRSPSRTHIRHNEKFHGKAAIFRMLPYQQRFLGSVPFYRDQTEAMRHLSGQEACTVITISQTNSSSLPYNGQEFNRFFVRGERHSILSREETPEISPQRKYLCGDVVTP